MSGRGRASRASSEATVCLIEYQCSPNLTCDQCISSIVKTSRIAKARLKSSEAPAEAFWRSVCNSGLLTAHKLPRQLRLVEPEPTRPPSRPAETGAAHPGLKTVLRRLLTAAPAALAAHFFGRRVYLRAAQAARPAPSAPPGQGASDAGACAAPTRPPYRRAPADPALALAAGKRAVRAPAAVPHTRNILSPPSQQGPLRKDHAASTTSPPAPFNTAIIAGI